jgi:hypothetical protein
VGTSEAVLKNNISVSCGVLCFDYGTSTLDSNNVSSDTSALGTSARVSQNVTFVNAGLFDFHLHAADGGARNFGSDTTYDSTLPIETDNDGAASVNKS